MTSDSTIAHLADRGVILVRGPDTRKFLQSIVTNDVDRLQSQPAIHAGLLSPQGKLLFDFFVVTENEGIFVDVARDRVADLIKRLTLYKLRAQVTISNVSELHAVLASWGERANISKGLVYADPRLHELGLRAIVPVAEAVTANASAQAYHGHRIGLGVPEGGRDYPFGDTFPHEALFDQLDGVSFTKGCYVGQEIVSRMEHRGTARKRIVPVVATDGVLREGAPVAAGEVEIGTIGSVAGPRALALIRLDRAEEFGEKGVPLTADGTQLQIALAPWARFKGIAAHG